jgi:hypothetical protein
MVKFPIRLSKVVISNEVADNVDKYSITCDHHGRNSARKRRRTGGFEDLQCPAGHSPLSEEWISM